MRNTILAALGAAALFAAPAFAQTSASPGTSSQANESSSMQALTQAQQKITTDLQRDGYQNVRVIPDSFLVHAKNKQGENVVMIINPDSVFSVTQLPSSQASATNPSGTGSRTSGLGSSSSTTTKQ